LESPSSMAEVAEGEVSSFDRLTHSADNALSRCSATIRTAL
jgi:hypothetical protein